jgi:hypothetical protein
MHRRDVIRAVAMGLAVPAVGALAPGPLWARARAVHDRLRGTRQDGPLLALTPMQGRTVAALAEVIIPETDTPGAAAAGVHRFVDVMLAEWAADEERDRFLQGLDALESRSRGQHGAPFHELTGPQRSALVRAMDDELTVRREAGQDIEMVFFYQMKRLTLIGYYTSEIGATQELPRVIAPGAYEPCGPVRRELSGAWVEP